MAHSFSSLVATPLYFGNVLAEYKYNGNGGIHSKVEYTVKLNGQRLSMDKLYRFIDEIARRNDFQIPSKEISSRGALILKWEYYKKPSDTEKIDVSFEKMKTIGMAFEDKFLLRKGDSSVQDHAPQPVPMRT